MLPRRTQAQDLAIRLIQTTGELVRTRGGFWTPDGQPHDSRREATHVGTQTVRALLRHGIVEDARDPAELHYCNRVRLKGRRR